MKEYDLLENLALDLRSSWHHSTDAIWKMLAPELWQSTHNPWAVLQTASKEKLKEIVTDAEFKNLLKTLAKQRQNELDSPTWFHENHADSALKCIAYFSMEFMLSEALPIYSGGLGNVAGDQLKAASDLGVPVIGIGLLYAQGYFRQFIDKYGNQQEIYPYNNPGDLPIKPLRLPDGEWLRFKLDFPGWPLWLRAWEVTVGRRTLYLLDSNDMANIPAHRGITSELYGGDRELRLKQELVLGLGGWRMLHLLGIEPEVCHMNEGHAAFAVLERAYCCMQKTKHPFDVAMAITRAGNLFTTHTAVPEGFDQFSPDLISQYLGDYAQGKLGISIDQLLRLGQMHPYGDFNMAYLAIRSSSFVNGVSQLHGEVSRHLFQGLFPRFPENEVPIQSITNGVHMPSWDAPASDALWSDSCGKKRWLGTTEELEAKIREVPDAKIWAMRNQLRAHLVDYARGRLCRQLQARGVDQEMIQQVKSFLNPDVLTLGFARRFASYKRADLLLTDEDRFLSILTNQDRPVQLIIAGKAHPADGAGHALIKKWMNFIVKPEVRASVVFLSDYDMILTEHLVQGVDLWVNTPRRPWEASGTSGMKVLVNGGLNLSELDGWWAEAYCPEVGWAIGDRKEHGDDPNWDKQEAYALYDLLEKEIIPTFYTRNTNNIPVSWTTKIRESMAKLTPYFSSNRTVREYTEKFYLPAAKSFQQRNANQGKLGKQITAWQHSLKDHLHDIHFGDLKIKSDIHQHRFEIEIHFGNLDPKAVKVELYSPDLIQEMKCQNKNIYYAEVSATYPASHFTPRILPYFPNVHLPLEAPYILWQR